MTSLDRFINTLIAISQPGSFLERYRLGWGLLYRKYQHIRKRIKSRHLPTSGFREDLVQDGQQGQMYRHLYFHLACYLMGPLGKLFSWFIGLTDIKQAASGRLESATEVRDNVAGRACGLILRDYLSGRLNEEETRKQLRQILAEPAPQDLKSETPQR